MPINLRKLFRNPESSSLVMLICGLLSVLASLAVAVVVWQRWDAGLGINLGPKALLAVIILSSLGLLLALASGIWALQSVEKLTGSNGLKCTIAYLLDAVAVAVLIGFIIVTFFLRVGSS